MPYMTQKAISRQLNDEIANALDAANSKSEADEKAEVADAEADATATQEPETNAGEVEEVPPAEDAGNENIEDTTADDMSEEQPTEYEDANDEENYADETDAENQDYSENGDDELNDAEYSEEGPSTEIASKEVSTTFLNDNYRNEHLYDLTLKLKELCEKYKFILQELNRDELSEKQFIALREEENVINSLIDNIDKLTTDYFVDRLYNENLITYLHLRSSLVASIRRLKQLMKV